jgi:AbrB family looped-hinge helix DNA binding protein
MRTTIDKAGRLVIPKPIRDQLGLRPGTVEVVVEGSGLRVEPVAHDDLEDSAGWLVIPATGLDLDDADVSALRDADRR